MDQKQFLAAVSELGLSLPEETLAKFDQFEADLYKVNEIMNLTRVAREDCWLRHFVDSLLISPLIRAEARVLDLGTGPGFPAWPLAVARPDLGVTALDSSGKMLGFLRDHPLPNLSTALERAEEWEVIEVFDVVTGRALAPLSTQLELSAKACKLGGSIIPMRTPNDELVLPCVKELGLELGEIVRRTLPGTDVVRILPTYRKVRPTPSKYPRKWADIKRSPLT